jgi:hypothetical protein
MYSTDNNFVIILECDDKMLFMRSMPKRDLASCCVRVRLYTYDDDYLWSVVLGRRHIYDFDCHQTHPIYGELLYGIFSKKLATKQHTVFVSKVLWKQHSSMPSYDCRIFQTANSIHFKQQKTLATLLGPGMRCLRVILSLTFFSVTGALRSHLGYSSQPLSPRLRIFHSSGPRYFPVSKIRRSMANSSSSSSSTTEKNAGKKRGLYSFAEARKIARSYGFSQQEFLDYDCPGAYQLPKNPQEVWKEEWKGWDDFLGICLDFEEGRAVARNLEGVDTKEAYLQLFKEKRLSDDDIASRLPYRPDLKYKDKWISWDDFLRSE